MSGSWGQVQINAALAHLGQGEIDGAAVRLAPVLTLPPPMRLATFAGKLGCAALLLAGPGYQGSVAASNLADQIGSYLGTPGTGALSYPVTLELAGKRR